MGLGPAYARGERTGELSNTCMDGVEALDAYFSQYLPSLALAALVPLTFLVFIFPLDWLSAAGPAAHRPADPAVYGPDRQPGPGAHPPPVDRARAA